MRVIDSHTGGEPTRVIVEGGPDLGTGPLAERRERFAREFDAFRSFAINEPRGSDILVGALLCEPEDESCAAGVIFFNNVAYLGMCGHGMIGLAVTLCHLGRIGLGKHLIETPVGVVTVELKSNNLVCIENVPSYRHLENVSLDVEGLGEMCGDVAWGGNWFYLVKGSPFPLRAQYTRELTAAAERVKLALQENGITGADGAEIDHVEFEGPPEDPEADGRNFVLCPGGAYDRSPCGTGTSAKLACLAASGQLQPGELWIAESVIGSRFEGSYRLGEAGRIIPSILGSAFICGEATLILQLDDPFPHGIVSEKIKKQKSKIQS